MFKWLKQWKEKRQKTRRHNIIMAYGVLENGLKNVENYWLSGSIEKGDELFEAIYNACVVNFIEYSGENDPTINKAQYVGLDLLIKFLTT